jgi:hypothetical protein
VDGYAQRSRFVVLDTEHTVRLVPIAKRQLSRRHRLADSGIDQTGNGKPVDRFAVLRFCRFLMHTCNRTSWIVRAGSSGDFHEGTGAARDLR